ncbi:hypothetical protein [Streptomyces sp. 769]|uniref:hypothetical protein n=1 Tax=Streptomyces sp. 769 TaxID=1262452 RepID=UPI000581FCD9|nr:hypothetical protein [Streptomyces sp. 769]AJC61983.1 hypothetical protein GZL_p00053 [Streptomyces sp. 769]
MFRFLRRKPSESSIAVIDISAFSSRHNENTCADLAAISHPMGPLVSEMIALHTHTRHLEWLSERENCPDEYRLLARSIVRQVMAGWRHQTGGRGTIDDLLTDDAGAGRGPDQDDGPSVSGPVSRTPDLRAPELAQSAPQQSTVPWWSQARGQQ